MTQSWTRGCRCSRRRTQNWYLCKPPSPSTPRPRLGLVLVYTPLSLNPTCLIVQDAQLDELSKGIGRLKNIALDMKSVSLCLFVGWGWAVFFVIVSELSDCCCRKLRCRTKSSSTTLAREAVLLTLFGQRDNRESRPRQRPSDETQRPDPRRSRKREGHLEGRGIG